MTTQAIREVTAGSVCSGYGGLDLAVALVFGARARWFADNDPAAAAVLAHHWPDVPNLGDIRGVDWTTVPPVDVMTGGTPCQDISVAGKRAGLTRGTRSGVWHSMCDAVEILRPTLVLWENVRGALSAKADSAVEPCPRCLGDIGNRSVLRALGRVLGDLADLGYDAVWCGLPAAGVGCAHLRWRIFVAAVDTRARNWPLTIAQWCAAATADPGRHEGPQDHPDGAAAAGGGRVTGGHAGPVVADTDGGGVRLQPVPDRGGDGAAVAVVAGPQHPVADPTSVGHDGRVSTRGRRSGSEEHGGGVAADPAGPGRGREEPGDDTGHGGETSRVGAPQPRRRGGTATDPEGERRAEGLTESAGQLGGHDAAERDLGAAAHPDVDQRERQPRQQPGGAAVAGGGGRTPSEPDPAGSGIDWREYTAAIRHHELILGRPAPDPTITGMRNQPKLSPWFTEWLMALPAGHVTGVPGLTANQQLKLCGNGVVIAQAAEAFRWLAARLLDTVADCTDCPDCDGCQDEGVA